MNRSGGGISIRSTRLLGVCIVLVSTGCFGLHQNLAEWSSFSQRDSDAIVVLSVSPRARVKLYPGEIGKYGWRSTTNYSKTAWSENGFVVLKVPPRTGEESYAIVEVEPDGYGSDRYSARMGAMIPV